MHVPVEIKGQKCHDQLLEHRADAFTPPAQAVLTAVAKIMTAPKDDARADGR